MKIENLKRQSGQIALVVLLIMIVMLTLGISVAQRGLFDVTLSQQEEESSRAFQAAETGVEEALRTLVGTGGAQTLTGDTSYNVTVNEGGTSGFVVGQPIDVGDAVDIDLSEASGLASVDIYFIDKGKENCTANPAALEAAVVEQAGPNTTIGRSAFDVTSRGNGFTVVTQGNYQFEGKTWCGRGTVSGLGNAVSLRLRPVYSRVSLGVDPQPGNAVLPAQYRLIRGEGMTASGVTRAVEVQRANPQLPTIFDYVLFSGGTVTK